MYFWNTAQLVSEIKSNQLSESQKKSYYLAMSVFMTTLFYLTVVGNAGYSLESGIIEALLQILVLVVGIKLTFAANGGEGSQNYIERMTLLSLPVLVKTTLISLLLGILMGLVLGESMYESAVQWPMVLLSVSVQIFYFWRLIVHLESLNSQQLS